MRKKRIVAVIVIVFIFLTAFWIDYVGIRALNKPLEELTSLEQAVKPRFGLDLKGGVKFVLEAESTPETQVTREKMESTLGVLERRVNNLGLSEAIVVQEKGAHWMRIDVELPGWKDPQRAKELIGQTALLEFKTEDGTVVLTGDHIKDANLAFSNDPESLGEPIIQFKLDSEGTKIFADVTAQNVGKTIAIYLDSKLLMNPVVRSAITGGEGIIEGGFTAEEAADHAALLRSGALPLKLNFIEEDVVGPSLGQRSVRMALIAIIIAILLIFLYMVFFYRFLGVLATIALVFYMTVEVALLFLLHATLSLPAIGGAILSLGMAVDINVIVFERMKEELKLGKSTRSIISAGFAKALRTVFDSNLTVLVGAIVLFYFGSGVIKGFAVTVSVGILVGFLSGVVVTHSLANLLIPDSAAKKPWMFGI